MDSAPWSGDPTRIRMEEELQKAIAAHPGRILQTLLQVAPQLDRNAFAAKVRAYELAISLAADPKDRDQIQALIEREASHAIQDEEHLRIQSLLSQLRDFPPPERAPAEMIKD
jgi:hypothetical protein